MLAPESVFLRASEPRGTLRKFVKGSAWRKTLTNFVAATEISVIIPNTLVLPKVVKSAVEDDGDFYVASSLPVHILASDDFVRAFVAAGKVTLFSQNRPNTVEDNVAVAPNGTMVITLAPTAKPVPCGLKDFDFCVTAAHGTTLALVDLAAAGKNAHRLRRIHETLSSLPASTFRGPFHISWAPSDAGVCPSSIAKFLHDRGVDIRESLPSTDFRRISTDSTYLESDSATDCDFDAVDEMLGASLLSRTNSAAAPQSTTLVASSSGLFDDTRLDSLVKAVCEVVAEGKVAWGVVVLHDAVSVPVKAEIRDKMAVPEREHVTLVCHSNKTVTMRTIQEY